MMSTPAGWYADPTEPARLRWWDGASWTEHVHPAQPVAAAPSSPDTYPPATVIETPLSVPPVPAPARRGLFGGRKGLEAENEELRNALAAVGVAERDALAAEAARLRTEIAELTARRDALAADVVATSEAVVLQEVGIYTYRHPLTDAAAYKARLEDVANRIKHAAKSGGAVTGSTTWQVNNSRAKGEKMIREFSKLMLRAYNNEADNCVRTMRPYMLEASVARLDKARSTITRLGKTMDISVTDDYHRLRIAELELTADYLAKVAEEKELEREEKARLREEAVARREYEREQARLEKERAHYAAALAALQAKGDDAAAADVEAKLGEIDNAIEGVVARAANARAGYVYVISNVGAFGERMVKVGLTRRLDPMDRVRELGDASVPFRYDVHAIIFSDDAVSLEAALHRSLDERRVNRVNARREFFYATPVEIRTLLEHHSGQLLSWVDEPEALEWHQSSNASRAGGAPNAALLPPPNGHAALSIPLPSLSAAG